MAILTEITLKESTENHKSANTESGVSVNGSNSNNIKWIKRCSPQYLLLISMAVMTILSSMITLFVLITTYHSGSAVISNSVNHTVSTTRNNLIYTDKFQAKLKIIPRQVWLAQPPTEPLTPLVLPSPYIIIHHTATENCSDTKSCIRLVRSIQSFHIDNRGWWDIGYNFLVGGDGNVYEGRGWKSQGAHTYGYNARSIGIAFIGNFNSCLPPAVQIHTAKELIQAGVERGYIARDYKLFAVRQLKITQSPGAKLYEDIKTWRHWSEKL